MRKILISRRDEFSYRNSQPNSLGYAIKRLGAFLDAVEVKQGEKKQVAVSTENLTNNGSKLEQDCIKL